MPSKPISEALPDLTLKRALVRFLEKRGHRQSDVMIEAICADASTRQFYRLISSAGDSLAVIMVNPPSTLMAERENFAYLNIGKHLWDKGICVSEMYAYRLDSGWFIMEDLGNRHLQEIVLSRADPLPIYRKVLEQLVSLQIRGAEGFDPSWCCQTEVYDRTVMCRYESHYFRDAFLKRYLGLEPKGSALESAFAHLAEKASKAECRFFIHRDFQSRNLMVSEEKIGIVDWQGGRMGPLGYDLASLLVDPYTDLSPQHKDELYATYFSIIRDTDPIGAESLVVHYPYLAIQRNLQILGAFSHLTQTVQKPHFAAYIPAAVASLNHLLEWVRDSALLPLKDVMGRVKERIVEKTCFGP